MRLLLLHLGLELQLSLHLWVLNLGQVLSIHLHQVLALSLYLLHIGLVLTLSLHPRMGIVLPQGSPHLLHLGLILQAAPVLQAARVLPFSLHLHLGL